MFTTVVEIGSSSDTVVTSGEPFSAAALTSASTHPFEFTTTSASTEPFFEVEYAPRPSKSLSSSAHGSLWDAGAELFDPCASQPSASTTETTPFDPLAPSTTPSVRATPPDPLSGMGRFSLTFSCASESCILLWLTILRPLHISIAFTSSLFLICHA
jgi:hypothetical protein